MDIDEHEAPGMAHKIPVFMRRPGALLATSLLTAGCWLAPAAFAESLAEAVTHSVETHPDVRTAVSRWRASQARITLEQSAYRPKLDVNASGGWQHRSEAAADGKNEDSQGEASILLQQPLFDGFAASHRVTGARAEAHSHYLRTLEAAQRLALQVTQAYLAVVRFEQLAELARDNLAVHDAMHQQIALRAQAGLAGQADLDQVSSRRARARSNLVETVNGLSHQRNDFYGTVNRDPENLVMPASHPGDTSPLPASLDEALALAHKQNPGLQAADYAIKTREAQKTATRGRFLPRLDLEIGQTWRDGRSDLSRFNDQSDTLSARLNLSYNLYSGGADRARQREAIWSLESARARQSLNRRTVARELRQAWDDFVYMKSRLHYLKEQIRASRAVVKAHQKQFRLGKTSLLDLLDTENELFQVQRDFIQAVHSELMSRYRLLHHTGQLLDYFEVKLPDGRRPSHAGAGVSQK